MSSLTSLARVLAADSGNAQVICTVRHVHVSLQPIVVVPVVLAGETNAPLAALVGSDRAHPTMIVTRKPRMRQERLQFAERLADELLFTIDTYARRTEILPAQGPNEPRRRALDAPQIWVPNPAGVEFMQRLGRMTRFRSTSGPWPVAPSVRRLGTWLTWYAEQAEFADSSVLVAATQALTAMWATGQSSHEDGNLAALMAWLDPPAGMTAAEAALRAENAIDVPPAGPATDPGFDNADLEPMLRDLDAAYDDTVRSRRLTRMTAALRTQMQPTWDRVWRAIELLKAVPAGAHVGVRWERDRQRFTDFADYLASDGPPQPKHDGAVRGARRLTDMELRKSTFDAQRAADDPLVLAEYRLTGEAFCGVVTAADPNRVVRPGRSRVRRPLITVTTTDNPRFGPGDEHLHDFARDRQEAAVLTVTIDDATTSVVLELSGGMGRSVTGPLPPGSVPAVGDTVTYTQLKVDGYTRRGTFPTRETTPWTHGGPPAAADYVSTPDDAVEEWA